MVRNTPWALRGYAPKQFQAYRLSAAGGGGGEEPAEDGYYVGLEPTESDTVIVFGLDDGFMATEEVYDGDYTHVETSSWNTVIDTLDDHEDSSVIGIMAPETFTSTSTPNLNRQNVELWGGNTVVEINHSGDGLSISNGNSPDAYWIEFHDFTLTTTQGDEGITSNNVMGNVTFDGLWINGFGRNMVLSDGDNSFWGDGAHFDITLNNCVFTNNQSSWGFFGHGERLNISNCEFWGTSVGTHACRVTYIKDGYITDSIFSGGGSSQHALKLHGPAEDNTTSALGGKRSSDFGISGCTFYGGDSNAWTLSLGPQSSGAAYDERLRRWYVNDNHFIGGGSTQLHMHIAASAGEIKGNTFADELDSNGLVTNRGVELPNPPELVYVEPGQNIDDESV